ncbi:MAG: leucine-rich repeat protein [Bacteroidales bacterium]|jgi:hypothetical protein|nr:leucine-rich repeat protein [Bacteroidales bacterium]
MRRHLFLLIVCFFAINAYGQPYPGDGTIEFPWHIGDGGGGSNPPTSSVQAYVDIPTQTLHINFVGGGTNNMADFWSSLGGEAPWNPNAPYFYPNNSSIKNVVIHNDVTNIGERAFKDCSYLETIIIPNTVTKINKQAFYNCTNSNLVVSIPSSVTEIGGQAFWNCNGKLDVEGCDEILNFTRFYYTGPEQAEGWKYDWFKDSQIHTLILGRNYDHEDVLFSGMPNLQNLTIGEKVTLIYPEAFKNCTQLETIDIKDGSPDIFLSFWWAYFMNDGTFYGCDNLTSLYLGRNLESHGGFTNGPLGTPFKESKLKYITIGSSVTKFNENSFKGCGELTSLTFKSGSSLTSIADHAFDGCSKLQTELIIPEKVTYIGVRAFNDCFLLPSVIIPPSVEEINAVAFKNCKRLKTVEIKGEDTSPILEIWGDAWSPTNEHFKGCDSLETLYLDRNLPIGDGFGWTYNAAPFRGISGLKYLTIGNNVETINADSFRDCIGLKNVSIGSGVNSIGTQSFYNCSGLEEIHSLNPVPPTTQDNQCFYDVYKTCNLFVPIGSENSYNNESQPEWKKFFDNVTYNFDADGGFYDITVTFNQSWNASSNEEWLTISPTSGKNTATFTMIAIKNPTNSSRSAIVTIICDGLLVGTINVTQDEGIIGIDNVITGQFQIYPNPVGRDIFIGTELLIEKVEIYSIAGTLLKVENNFKEKISASDLAKGLYFLKVCTDKGVIVSKFVKE